MCSHWKCSGGLGEDREGVYHLRPAWWTAGVCVWFFKQTAITVINFSFYTGVLPVGPLLFGQKYLYHFLFYQLFKNFIYFHFHYLQWVLLIFTYFSYSGLKHENTQLKQLWKEDGRKWQQPSISLDWLTMFLVRTLCHAQTPHWGSSQLSKLASRDRAWGRP